MLPEYPVLYYRGSPPLYRYGRGKDARGERLSQPLVFSPPASWDGFDHAVYGQDELNPQWIELVRRAPVNVNSAPLEVLIALLEGLKGFFLVERRRNEPPAMANVYDWLISRSLAFRPSKPEYQTGEIGFLYSTVPIEGPATGTGAHNSWSQWIAEEILACRE